MPSPCQRKLATPLQRELERLKLGAAAERQRYVSALSAMNKVMADPLHADYRKNLPESYKAADVLQQYRLFFKIIPATSPTDRDVVFFAWINDEESIHRSGEADDCYSVFRRMVERGEVEAYVPDLAVEHEGFKIFEWGSEYVYASYWRRGDREEQRADSHLPLSKVTALNYLLQHVNVSVQNAGLAQALLERLCVDADRHGVEITYELLVSESSYGKSRHLLEKFKFEYDDTMDSVEIWTKTPARPSERARETR